MIIAAWRSSTENIKRMSHDDALLRYRSGEFTDADITRCTGLSVRAWRELIRIKAVQTVTERRGRGRVRRCDATVFKRSAAIAALNGAGLSLPLAGRIAYFWPLHSLLYAVCDPCTILFELGSAADPTTGLPPMAQQPKVDWFDPDKPAKAEPETDWTIEIYDGRFVGARYNLEAPPAIFGEIRSNREFVAWLPFDRRAELARTAIATLAQQIIAPHFVDFIAQWSDPTKASKELKVLDYRTETHHADDDPLYLRAEAAVRAPLVKTSVNVTLAIRKALRRYLGIEPPDASVLL